MSILAVDVGDTAVTAVVVGDTGVLEASSRGELARHAPAPGRLEYAPEELWQTTLAVTRAVLARVDRAALRAVGVTNQPGTVLLWDRETLGSPRRALAGLAGPAGEPDSVGARLSWIADHEPRTWALVEEGRYAVGTVDSYLVARMTRGTWHVTDVANASATALLDLGTGDWSDESCAEHGVPRDALPEVVDSWGTLGTTDRASYCGLDLPITGLVGEGPATLFGQACFDLGDSVCLGEAPPVVLTNAGQAPLPGSPRVGAAWRAPDAMVTYAATSSSAAGALRVDRTADDDTCRRLADGFGVPVERSTVGPAAVIGAAWMAGLGAGLWPALDDLRTLWTLDRRFDPAPVG